jgi:hypothetical protein
VAKHLGSCADAKVFAIDMTLQGNIPTSQIKLVESDEARMQLITDLGYELFDFDLYKGYLILAGH